MDNLGPMLLTSYLKSKGHHCKILVDCEEKDVSQKLKDEKPDFIAFSITTGIHQKSLETAAKIKTLFPNIKTVFGGSHATFFPEMISLDAVDIVCRGEGEDAILDLANHFDEKKDFSGIKNLWIKVNGNIVKNDVRPLIQELDSYPLPDREFYSRYKIIRNYPSKPIITSRGCPYSCTFCFNHSLKKIYEGKGKYIRQRSVDHVLSELKAVKDNHPIRSFSFVDDSFLMNPKWVNEFLDRYKNEIDVPFFTQIRVNTVTDELIEKLAWAGCIRISVGLESGNDFIREKILKKTIKREEIIKAAGLFKKHKIKFRTYNMIGSPGETVDNAFETIELNSKIKTDYPWASIIQPYPRTELGEYVEQKGFSDKSLDVEKYPISFMKESLIKQENIKQLINVQKLFYLLVKFPNLQKLARKLIKYPLGLLFEAIFSITYIIGSAQSYNLKLHESLILAFKMRKLY
jgi:anaerobic magnesium-protoporphyrin IX monomethyl ester cyclase